MAKGKGRLPKYEQNSEKQSNFNTLLLNMIVHTGVPFNLVEKDAFATLIENLDSRLQVPSRRTLKRLLNEKNDKVFWKE